MVSMIGPGFDGHGTFQCGLCVLSCFTLGLVLCALVSSYRPKAHVRVTDESKWTVSVSADVCV